MLPLLPAAGNAAAHVLPPSLCAQLCAAAAMLMDADAYEDDESEEVGAGAVAARPGFRSAAWPGLC